MDRVQYGGRHSPPKCGRCQKGESEYNSSPARVIVRSGRNDNDDDDDNKFPSHAHGGGNLCIIIDDEWGRVDI